MQKNPTLLVGALARNPTALNEGLKRANAIFFWRFRVVKNKNKMVKDRYNLPVAPLMLQLEEGQLCVQGL